MRDEVEPKTLRYGWGNIRPSYLQFMNNAKCFVFFVVLNVLGQGMIVGGFTNALLSTIEKRYQFTSKEAGFIAGSNDISAILLTSVVSFYGGYGSKPRWLGYGALLTGIGCFLFALPQLLVGPYQPDVTLGFSNTGSQGICRVNTTNTTASSNNPQCFSGYEGNWYYLMIFSIAQMVMGAGTIPLYTLAPAYIDENVHPKSCPVYFGVFYAAVTIGPGLGFTAGGAVLSIYVDVELPQDLLLTAQDPRWIGAWWLGYVIGGSFLLLLFVFLLGFPQRLPGAQERREQLMKDGILPSQDKHIKNNLKDIIPSTLQLLKNPVCMFTALAVTASTFTAAGVVPFFVKVLYAKFNLNPSKAGQVLGIMIILSTGGGIFIGGLLVRRFKLKESLLKAAKYCVMIKAFIALGSIVWMLPGCKEVQLAGITKPYWDSPTNAGNSLFSTCNGNCSCPLSQIRPVCGAGKLTYFSPCFAGCTSSTKKGRRGVYSNCSCISPAPINISGPQSVRGFCDRGSGCDNYKIFLAILGSAVFINFFIVVPQKTVVLRSVPDNLRSYALGFQLVVRRCLGFLPGPIVYGWFVDSNCLVWGQSCGRRGSCQFYDVNSVSFGFMCFGGALHGTSALLYFISFWFCRRNNASDKGKLVAVSTDEVQELVLKETSL